MTEKDIEIREDSMSPAAVQARIQYAKALSSSDLLPVAYRGKPANVLIAVEMGNALGLKPMAALNGIAVINGKPTLSADLMAAVVRNAGHKLRVEEKPGAVRATLIRSDDPDFSYEAIWDQGKAEKAGLWGKGNWVKYPGQMLRARAISEVIRQGASECLFGAIYTPEELESVATGDDPKPLTPQQQCSQLVREHVAKYGGDVDQLRQAWVAQGGKADPHALAQWLTTQPDGGIIDAEIVEEEEEQ